MYKYHTISACSSHAGSVKFNICLLLSENDGVVSGCRYASAVKYTESLDWTGCLWMYIKYRQYK